MDIKQFLRQGSIDGFLPFSVQKEATDLFNSSFRDIERIALELGIVPLRYKKNQSTINIYAQKKLFNAHIAIIGCGGLGGYISEILTRVGIGRLSLFDFDVFEEHNLNRQNFSSLECIGKEKVIVIKEALEKINPAIKIDAFVKKIIPKKDFALINQADVVVDALDNPETKLELAKLCKDNNTHFVHGAIAGLSGQFTSNNTLEHLYHDGSKGAEVSVGNLSFSVTFAASIQSVEVIKLIVNIGKNLDDLILIIDLLEYEFLLIPFKKS